MFNQHPHFARLLVQDHHQRLHQDAQAARLRTQTRQLRRRERRRT